MSRRVVLLLWLQVSWSWKNGGVVTGQSSSRKKRPQYLYVDFEDPGPVLDYVVNETSTQNATRPDFLYSTLYPNPRIVEFYAPWCGHCQHYKTKYIALAKKLKMLHSNIEIHAISCTVHVEICHDLEIWGYPTVRAFSAASLSINGTDVKASSHPFQFLKALGLNEKSNTENDDEWWLDSSEDNVEVTIKSKKQTTTTTNKHVLDKNNIYMDAHASFVYAMRNHIFHMQGSTDKIQDKTKRKAFKDWIQLLQKAIPYQYHKLHEIVEEIHVHSESVMNNETFLMELLPDEEEEWSLDCTRGDNVGYTCGLWELFHICTLGVVEWNLHSIQVHDKIALSHAADTLRNYIAHFFPCLTCRDNFLSEYDACHYNKCQRLDPKQHSNENEYWKQLPLWLWETHNGVNVRLLNESLVERGATKTYFRASGYSAREVNLQAQWPKRTDCPTCWVSNENNQSWVEDQIYKYLRVQYWPDDATSQLYRQEVLPESLDGVIEDYLIMPPQWISLAPFLAIVLGICWWKRWKRYLKEKRRRRIRLYGTDQLLQRGMASQTAKKMQL